MVLSSFMQKCKAPGKLRLAFLSWFHYLFERVAKGKLLKLPYCSRSLFPYLQNDQNTVEFRISVQIKCEKVPVRWVSFSKHQISSPSYFFKTYWKKKPNNFYLVGFTTPELTASHIHSIQMTITFQPMDVALLNCCSYFKPMFNESQETFACGFTEIKEPLSSRSKIREMCPLKLITCGHQQTRTPT